MRLWSINPAYLDRAGLVATWREGLLAQAVLLGKTKGYKNHPQLIRFKKASDPIQAISNFLGSVFMEAEYRGYKFDKIKLAKRYTPEYLIPVTSGQMLYEFQHLQAKLIFRDEDKHKTNETQYHNGVQYHNGALFPNHAFEVVPGKIEEWEKIK